MLADKDFLVPIVAESGGQLVFVGEDVAIGGGVAMGVRESDGEMKEKLNAAIDSMKADGTMNTMLAKWFTENPPQW
jgi:polar amino acid transport system substrate-binding protein